MPARPAGGYRLRQRGGSADLNHMIDTASVRHILCLLAPVRHGFVINDGVGPETLELFQLLLGGRCRDDSGARSFRELQREQRYTTRAKDQHRITRLHLAAHDQASPGGDSRASERCRLRVRVACRCLRERVRRHAHVLAGIAVNSISRYIPLGRGRHFASQPIGPNRADDGICDLKLIAIVPTAITSPAPSDIGTRPSAHGIFPSTTISSWKFNELARILTSNSPGLGLGRSSSTNLRFAKPPGALSLTSLMNILFHPPRLAGAFYCRNTSSIRFCTFSYYW